MTATYAHDPELLAGLAALRNANDREARRLALRRAWIAAHDDLPVAAATAALMRLAAARDEAMSDPITIGSDCGELITRDFDERLDAAARRFGYPDADFVRMHATLRTCERWAHFNLGF